MPQKTVFERIKGILVTFRYIRGSDSLSRDTTLRSLKMGEGHAASFAVKVENEFGVRLPSTAVTAASTIGDIVALVEARISRT